MTTQTTLPLFYRQIEAFDSVRHGPMCRPAIADFRFAASATAIPLVISELPMAMRHYPLVFLPAPEGDAPALVALVGINNEHNLFVSTEGVWRADTYIPAYVRRYPFHAMRVEMQADPLLAIDATYVTASNGETLVTEDGKSSLYLDEMLSFTREYLAAAERTEVLCRALQQANVLEPGDITLRTAEGSAHQINGFLQVSEERLRALTPEALAKLYQADALGLAYGQLLSMVNFLHMPPLLSSPEVEKPSRASRKDQGK